MAKTSRTAMIALVNGGTSSSRISNSRISMSKGKRREDIEPGCEGKLGRKR